MTLPSLFLPLNGSLAGQDASGVVTATGIGALSYVAGKWAGSQAAFVKEGTTNVVPNPWFAVSTTGWSAAAGAISRDTTYAVQGPASGLLTATGTNAEATIPVTLTATVWTLQAIVRNNAATARQVQLRYNGANAGAAISVAPGATATLTAQVTGVASAAAAGVRVVDNAAGETWNLGYFGVENKEYATWPCPAIDAGGTVLGGYSWSGTAHNSSSTRAQSKVLAARSYLGTSPSFALVGWVTVTEGAFSTGNPSGIFVASSGSGNWPNTPLIGLLQRSGVNTLGVYLRLWNGAATPYTLGQTVMVGFDYDATTQTGRTFVNDQITWSGAVAQPYDVDTAGNMEFSGSGYWGPVMTFDRPLTDTERLTLYQASEPWTYGMLQPPPRRRRPPPAAARPRRGAHPPRRAARRQPHQEGTIDGRDDRYAHPR